MWAQRSGFGPGGLGVLRHLQINTPCRLQSCKVLLLLQLQSSTCTGQSLSRLTLWRHCSCLQSLPHLTQVHCPGQWVAVMPGLRQGGGQRCSVWEHGGASCEEARPQGQRAQSNCTQGCAPSPPCPSPHCPSTRCAPKLSGLWPQGLWTVPLPRALAAARQQQAARQRARATAAAAAACTAVVALTLLAGLMRQGFTPARQQMRAAAMIQGRQPGQAVDPAWMSQAAALLLLLLLHQA